MAMAHDTVAAIRQFQILPHGDKGISFRDQRLSQHAAGAFTCKFAQRIVDGLTLTESDDSGIFSTLRIPEKATTLSGACRPRDPVDDDQGGARA